MTVLLGCWLFFTLMFMTHNEKVEHFNYTLDISNSDSVLIKLSGPFLSGHAEMKLNKSVKETANRLIVWFENDTHEISTQWHVFLQRDNLNFNEGESREHIFRMATNSTNSKLRMRTTTSSLIALRFSFTADPLDGNSGVVYAVILLLGLYVLIIFEVINRTMAALIVSTTSIAALALVGERPTLPEIISWLDVETLLLLFSMMILVMRSDGSRSGTNIDVYGNGINFTNFTAHMSFGVLFIVIQTSLQIRYIYRDVNKLRLKVPRDIQDLRHQISIWRRAVDSLPHLSQGVHVVRERLERKIIKLNKQLDSLTKEINKRACPKDTFRSTLDELKAKYKIRDKNLLIKSTVAIIFVVTVFFLHSLPELNRVSLGMTALLGAILLLTLADREDLEPILHRVEWSTLLFFAALFVLMEALSKLGLILYIGGLMEQLIVKVDEEARLAVALMVILWVSGTISAFVDNIPLTTMMVRVVVSIGSNPTLNLPMAPLIWALLFGACLGGNGTLIGASANVVCAGVAEQHGYKFTFMQFFRIGFPVMIGHLIVSSVYLLICHCVFEWH
ncbi:unnamed protein product [Leptidea sinapis]|uniref:Citrate transporter-like domain-containing protein n=1 Tax=Leptidea sinapis TaxID=189913 RepID=A0A5E4QFN5_9NEOP|nr:unnamed protein product [Leptidea sinapis]